MTIYEELTKRVSEGESFYVNFKNRSLKIGKKFIIADGVYDSERELIKFQFNDINTILEMIEDLYRIYKTSLPSERSESKRRTYFKALNTEEMTDEQLMFGDRREMAQARLEGFILCMIVNGKFKWNEQTMGKWFWQSKTDSSLVILRDWVENN